MGPLLYILVLSFVSFSYSANPPTVVIDLNERFLEVKDQGFWIVKFYAPWCAHCKRLAPTWEHLGHALQDKNLPVRVAKMDCTRFQSACNAMEIRGYPTIMFFRNGRKVDYNGERSKEALLNFCIKSSAPLVENLNAVRLTEVRSDSRHDPSFLLIGDGEDGLKEEFEALADVYFSKTRFFTAKPESVTSAMRDGKARVVVLKDDTFVAFDGAPEDLKTWVKKERWPLLPKASHSNIAEMATNGKYLVLGVVTEMDRFNQSSEIGQFYSKFSAAANDMRKAEHLWDIFQFAWLDGGDIASGIAMGNMDPPAILVFNYSSYEYFLSYDDPQKMTKSSILTWLDNLSDSIYKGTAMPLGGRSWHIRIRRMAYELYSNVVQMFATQPLLSACLFGVPIAFLSIICYSICSADMTVDRDEFYPDEDEEEVEDEEYIDDPNHEKRE